MLIPPPCVFPQLLPDSTFTTAVLLTADLWSPPDRGLLLPFAKSPSVSALFVEAFILLCSPLPFYRATQDSKLSFGEQSLFLFLFFTVTQC